VASDPTRAKAMMGVVPQETAIYDDLSARANVSFWGRLYGLQGAELRRRSDEVLELVGLAPADKRGVKKFSGGMKRRLNLAMGLVHRPRLLLLDEPTVGIDPQGRHAVLDVVQRVAAEGTAILYTTHYLEEAENLCRRIGIIDHGRILAEGTTPELRRLVGEGTVVTIRGGFTGPAFQEGTRSLDGARVLSLEDGNAMLSVPGDRGGVGRVLSELMKHGIAFESVSVREPSLESVFIKLTGRELRD
jgi:ABC-2 type transport system ATP-binding protein